MKQYFLLVVGCVLFVFFISYFIPKGKFYKQILGIIRMACITTLLLPIISGFKNRTDTVFYREQEITSLFIEQQSKRIEDLILTTFQVNCHALVDVQVNENIYEISYVDVELYENEKDLITAIEAYLKELGYINNNVHAKIVP